jgi:transmembrane sensor
VETGEGTVQALGTRFVVRQESGFSRAAVFEGTVRVTALDTGRQAFLQPGQTVRFTRDAIAEPVTTDESVAAWTDGVIVADKMRLDEFIAELGRYRSGRLACDPAVADMRVSGVFPLNDTDRALAALTDSLPVRIETRTRYWVTVARL